MKPPKPDAMKTALDKKGSISLYINFDFNKATLRPDAAPIVAQVETLLKDNPDLKLEITGNTDNVGGHDYNVKLSQARAAMVVAALVKDGIAAERLKATGNGPDKPIADNGDSRGRAKNRRVDLVKM
jgi:outer membrane protein OmpA-like peptidoglycan-associated protein